MTQIKIVRKFLTPDELSNPNQRYNADCDCVQTSYDGGDTWTDTPNADPRHFTGNLYPPTTGMDPQCLSAGNMVDRIKFILDTFIESATIFQATTSVLNILILLLPGAGILIDLVLAIAEALFDIGLVVVDAALTSGVYDQLLCIIYCEIGADGQVSPSQFSVIRSRVDEQIGGTAAIAIDYALSQLGEVGLSNAGTIGESTRDCSGCDCEWCYEIDFSVTDGGWHSFSSPGAVYTPGVGWTDHTVGGARGTYIESPTFTPAVFTHIELTYTALGNATSDVRYGRLSGTITMLDVCGASLGTDITIGWDGSMTFDQVGLQIGNSTSFAAGSSIISHAKFRGTGTNPFGSDNC